VGIPARDLSAEEVERYGGEEYLLSFGPPLYERASKGRKPNTNIRTTKEMADNTQDGDE
jgi:hypothetical protein